MAKVKRLTGTFKVQDNHPHNGIVGNERPRGLTTEDAEDEQNG